MITNWKGTGPLAATSIVWALLASLSAGQEAVATGEFSAAGSVSGSYLNTWTADGLPEAITEEESGGKPSKRKSLLEHTWVFELPPGDTATLHVRAWHTSNDENDHFTFAWSADGQGFTDLIAVTSTSDPGSCISAPLPPGTSGTLYVRARDTDRSPGNRDLDTVFVDHLYIESTTGGPPAAPTNLRTMDLSPSAIFMRWEDNASNEEGFRVERRQGDSGWTVAAWLAADTTGFEDGELSAATSYEYVVYAVSSSGDSPPSNLSSSTTRPTGAYGIELVEDVTGGQKGHDHDPLTGRPGIAYSGAGGFIHFASYDGLEWSVEIVEAGGAAISFAYSPTGVASISHVLGGAGGELHYVERVGGTWASLVIDDGVDGYVCTSLTHDHDGEPVIAYRKILGPKPKQGLKVARRSAGTWSTVLVDPGAWARYQSVAFDPEGNPGIAYSDGLDNNQGLGSLKFAHWNGTSWDIEIVESEVLGFGVHADLSYDSVSGHPTVCHGNTSRILSWDGVTWQLLTVFQDGDDGQIVHDPSGRLHVAYYSRQDGSELRIATWGGSWQDVSVDPRVGGQALCIALDPVSQQPTVSYSGGYLGVYGVKFASR